MIKMAATIDLAQDWSLIAFIFTMAAIVGVPAGISVKLLLKNLKSRATRIRRD